MSDSTTVFDIVVLCSDLFFASEIHGTAELHGISVRLVDTDAEAVQAVESHAPRMLIVDLRNPGLDCVQLVTQLPENRPQLLGFYPHVQAEYLEAAQAAGFDEIVTRGQFSMNLLQWIT
jgi:CheY-like chemotaxis protein